MVRVFRRPPLSVRLGTYLVRNGYRGGHRLLAIAERRGWLDRVIRYRLSPEVTFDVPLFRAENRWDAADIRDYDPRLVADLVAAVEAAAEPPIFVDCGADTGVVSVLVAAHTSRLREIVAVEPNPVAHAFLHRNVQRLSVPGRAIRAAVADVPGRGSLRTPAYDWSDHSRYLVRDPDGDVPIVRVDDLVRERGTSVVLKLDVEGAELAAVRGALETLRDARDFAVSFEAHPDVVARTATEPTEVIRTIEAVRPCATTVSDIPGMSVRTDRPFFRQVTDPRPIGYNILCRSVQPNDDFRMSP